MGRTAIYMIMKKRVHNMQARFFVYQAQELYVTQLNPGNKVERVTFYHYDQGI